jgi:ribA/ribD-fused uncharacterized protein
MKTTDWSAYKPENFEYVGGWVRNWFSNFAESPFILEGINWPSVENYYQAKKSNDPEEQKYIALLTPSRAKQRGRTITLRSDWESIKQDVMLTALRAKFSKSPWKERLLQTGDEMLIEWNNWNDKVWGVSIRDNKGQNLLGLALMKVRDELKNS